MTRRTGSAAFAVIATFGLFYLMQSLSALHAPEPAPVVRWTPVDFWDVPEDSEPERVRNALPTPTEAPPQIETADFDPTVLAPGEGVPIDPAVNWEGPDAPKRGTSFGADLPPTQLVAFAPDYPERPAQRGIGGWVLVEFTVNAAGMTEDVHVVDSEPPRTFDRAAVRAVQRWRYRPKTQNGEPVAQTGVQYVIRFDPESAQEESR